MDTLILEPIRGFLKELLGFLPRLLSSLVLILCGLLAAWLLKTLCVWVLRSIGGDTLAEKVGLTPAMRKIGIKEPMSGITGRVVYWVVLISFLIISLNALHVPTVEDLLARFFLYLPNVIVAVLILSLGYLVGNFLGRASLIALVNADVSIASFLGRFVRITVYIIATTMALELLGIGKDTVLVAFAIVFGGIVLALAIAFGIGGQRAAGEYIERKLMEEREKDEIEHI
ncbi:MAG: hypothetical protein JSV70_03810 [bacterium]|nr:MAG: hypothetical protein JSV70_03810 [bacterium]